MESNLKASVDELAKIISKLFSLTASKTAMEQISKFYMAGVGEMEMQFNMDFSGNKQNIKNFQKYVVEEIKGFNSSMKDRLRREVMESITNRESMPKLRARVQDTFKVARNRAEMIARTETNKAYNMGHRDAAIESGLKLRKFVSVHMDDRTSPICKRMNSKYGNESKSIPMNAKFVDKTSGKEFDISPFHVNCRTRILYTQLKVKRK